MHVYLFLVYIGIIMIRFYLLTINLLLATIDTIAFQNTGSLSGYAREVKTEEVLIGVAVRLVDTDLGAVTDINGFYTISNIPAKTYTVEASYLGYKKEAKYNVVVRSGGNPDLNFQLEETASELAEVVIAANPFEKLEETPLSIQKLSAEEIATYPGEIMILLKWCSRCLAYPVRWVVFATM